MNEWAKYDDYATFAKLYAPYVGNQSFKSELINGGLSTQNDQVEDDGEANLDVQYALPLSYPAKATYYSTGGLGELDFLHYLLELPDKQLPTTLSISYGENEQSVPKPCKS